MIIYNYVIIVSKV